MRITPTYMGNTAIASNLSPSSKDHPHIHGEYWMISRCWLDVMGSPPHTWGIHLQFALDIAPSGITPTYMGNTIVKLLSGSTRKDHPHIHGEYLPYRTFISVVKGSPPHTWGILVLATCWPSRLRITPTYMGNTTLKPGFYQIGKDHPHIHGEYVAG